MNTKRLELPDPLLYIPFRHGRYDVAPGLVKFAKASGDGVMEAADGHVFQIDRTFESFRPAKLAARAEGTGGYHCTSDLGGDVAAEVAAFVVRRLVTEHPQWFREQRAGDRLAVRCELTRETLTFDARMGLAGAASRVCPPYVDALDALACQVQEDLAIVSTSPARGHWLSAVHVSYPNGWAPAEKIGRSFAQVHEPVAGMAEMNRRGGEFAAIMVRATGGLVRFAWGVSFDDGLNHHPQRPKTPFDSASPRAFVRVERQTIWGFPAVGAALFTIRTYVYDCQRFRDDPVLRDALVAALRSMSAESVAYKGLRQAYNGGLIEWLARGT
jgi:hypothetical protein